jgi:hypothetical protein
MPIGSTYRLSSGVLRYHDIPDFQSSLRSPRPVVGV